MWVLVLSRGQLARHKDPFLTPVYPNVEGRYPDDEWPSVSRMTPKYLPIGSVVVLAGGDKKLMIYGRRQKDTAKDREFDYVGCPYPEGNISPKATFLFNHQDIKWIHYLGLCDEEEEALVERLRTIPETR